MADALNMVVSWQTFIVALLVYGFAPGALLRLICRAFHKGDPRRDELRAELYAVPRLERPFWVLEQLEVALFEGLAERIQWAATGRIIHRWHLRSGVEQNRLYPDSFWIPSHEDKERIAPGTPVKLMFGMKDGWGERMWVTVTEVKKDRLVGTLRNQPIGIPRLYWGDRVKFHRDDVIDVDLDVVDHDAIDAQPRLGPGPSE